jgi:hypothetical protein
MLPRRGTAVRRGTAQAPLGVSFGVHHEQPQLSRLADGKPCDLGRVRLFIRVIAGAVAHSKSTVAFVNGATGVGTKL